ncbi:GNAT family N-acetyltransferase [Streptomyces sp. NPDC059009]|uniref:GNAT family N-acetyltransferase n=1 Tax=Streptomyces sp. NPDC059009 TaxID=3346694 RepID=UPI003674D46A
MAYDAGPLFCDLALGERIERAEAELIATGSRAALARIGADKGADTAGDNGFVTPLAGGVACCTEEGSPLNKVAGLGFAGVPGADELGAVERQFAARGVPVQVELAHLADPALGEVLTARGYRLVGFENVLGRALRPGGGAEGRSASPGECAPPRTPGVEVRHSGEDGLAEWLDAVVGGFAAPDTQGVPSHEEFPRDILERAVRDMTAASGMRRYVARVDGAVAGGASMRIGEGIAQLTGAATLPAYRRRGVQSALLAVRLAEAAAQGCDLAVITTQPASTSQQNAQRRGFGLLYTRAVLVKS